MSTTRNRSIRLASLLLLLAVIAAACGDEDPLADGDDPLADDGAEEDDAVEDAPEDEDAADEEEGAEEGEPGVVTVGSANFPESIMLAEMYALALEDAGVEVETQTNIGAREVYYPALEQGEIDLLPEYVGSLLNFLQEDPVEATEVDELLEALRDEVADDVAVLEPSEAENSNALVVRPETAEEYDLSVTSDLEPIADELVAGGAPETRDRDDGLPGYERVYGIEFAEWVDLDPGGPLTIEALESGDLDVARLFTSMGVIAENDWVVLEDDGDLIPAENIVPVIREDVLTDEVEETLDAISEALTLDELVELNQRTEIDNEDPDLVAEDWLREQGLIG
jgi:osmoprotectant transport system substrate-binding protein